MFEGAFERLGKISEKHSGKIIIFWVVLLIVLTPFASLLFSETSYDLGGSITPANSMSTQATNLQTAYFSAGGTGATSSNQSMVIVTNGTDMNQNSAVMALLNSQNDISSYLSGQGLTYNFTSVVGTENSTLSGVATLASAFINGTFPLLKEMNLQSLNLSSSLLNLSQLIYAIPANYYANYSYMYGFSGYNNTVANLSAYINTTQVIESQFSSSPELAFLAFSYFNAFSYFINSTIEVNPVNQLLTAQDFNFSIVQTVTNLTLSKFVQDALTHNETQTLGLAQALALNLSFEKFVSPDQSAYNQSYANFTRNFVVYTLSTALASNSTVESFLSNQLNITSDQLVSLAYAQGYFNSGPELAAVTDSIVTNSTLNYFKGSPLISINSNTIRNFVREVNGTGNPNLTAYNTLVGGDFSNYPAVPAPYVYHQFVGYTNSTVITILTTNLNLTTDQVNVVGNTYRTHLSNLTGNTSYYLAGSSALSTQLASESLSGMVKALIIGIVLSVIIVGVFFRSPVAAFLPLLVFGFSAAISISVNALLYKYVIHGSISFITPTLLLILLLGLSSDYVVYIMSRYRREFRNGNPDATAVTSRWAGHAVFTSGITVGLSYVVLWLSGVPIFSDSGLTNAIGVVITILMANTFLIAILTRGKGKIFWPSKIDGEKHLPAEKGMQRVASLVLKHKGKILVIFLVSTILGGYLYSMTPTNMDVFKLVPSSSGIQAISVVNNSFNGDFFDRGFVVLEFSSPVVTGNSTYNMTEVNAINAVEYKLINSSEITQVYGPTFPYGSYVSMDLSSVSQKFHSEYRSQMNTFIGNDSRYVMIDFQLQTLAWESGPTNFVNGMPSLISNQSGATYNVYIGGLTESLSNSYTFTASTFVKMVPILAIAIFIVLLIQISSLFTPIRLIAMVFASVIISLALAYLALHFYAGLPILIFLPMFTVITLLAVGLDYDIFMVARVREEVYKGRTDAEGIRTSITENGGVIITLGTLLFATFGSLAFSGIGIIEEIGIGLAFGVLIDTFISWPFFVPSVMLYLKKYNWWPSRFVKQNQDKPKE